MAKIKTHNKPIMHIDSQKTLFFTRSILGRYVPKLL